MALIALLWLLAQQPVHKEVEVICEALQVCQGEVCCEPSRGCLAQLLALQGPYRVKFRCREVESAPVMERPGA